MTPPYAEIDIDAVVESVVGFRRFDAVVQALCDQLAPRGIPIEAARAEFYGIFRPGRTEPETANLSPDLETK